MQFCKLLLGTAVMSLCAALFVACAHGETTYHPRLVETLTESWRWREFPELKGRGLNCIEEGPNGAMWFGIDGGALRYDGLGWSEFKMANGLPATATSFASTGDNLFASTRSAIYAFKYEQWIEVFPGTTERVWIVEDLIAAEDGSLWAATNWGALQIANPQDSMNSRQCTLYSTQAVATYFDTDQSPQFKTVVVETPERDAWAAGSGIYVYGPIPNGQTVIALAEEGPAAKAGLMIGDQIVAVNGEDRETVFQNEIEIEPGRLLELTVKRLGEPNTLRFQLTATVDVPGQYEIFRPFCIAEAFDGTMWFATRIGKMISLSTSEDGVRSWTHHTNEHNLPSVAVPSIATTADGIAAVGRSTNTSAMIQFDGKKWQVRKLTRGIGASITALHDGPLLVGTVGAVISVSSSTHSVMSTQPHGISGNDVLVKQTADRAIWIAGKGSTVLRVEPQGRNWTSYEGLIYQGTNPDGSEWFISNQLSVVQREGENWKEYTSDDGLMTLPMTILTTKSGEVYAAGSHHGLAATALLENGKWTLKEHSRLSWTIDRRAACEDRDGRVWFGGASLSIAEEGMVGGVVRFNGSEWTHIEPTNRLTFTYQICQTCDGSMWCGGPSLVQILPNDRFGDLSQLPDKARGFCECCANDLDGNLWAGTRDHGLVKMSQQLDGHWSAIWFDETSGVSNNRIRNILSLADDSIVVHTTEGFDRYDGQSWTQPVFPQSLAPTIDAAGIRQSPDGAIWLNTSALPTISSEKARSGRIAFATTGLFRTHRYVADTGAPETQLESKITELLVGDDGIFSWSGTDPWNITPSPQLTYSWRVNAREWSPFTTATHIKISALPPGSHKLEVRCRDQDFNIDATPSVATFEVIPLIYNRAWFRLLLLLTVALLGLAVVQTGNVFRREAALRAKNAELISAEQQLHFANVVLEDRVVERTNELRETNQLLLREIEERIAAEVNLRESRQRYRSLVEMLPNSVQRIDLQGKITFVNPMHARMHGCPPEQLLGRYIWDFEVSDEKRQALKDYFHYLIEHQPPPTMHGSANRTIDGRRIETETTWEYDRDANGQLLGFVAVISEVTRRKFAEELVRAENKLLEAVAKGEPLAQALERLVAFVETQAPDLIASILLLDDDGLHLRHVAGDGLPRGFVLAIDGIAIGESVGSCGTAAFRGESVFTSDIATDPHWRGFRHLASQHGLAACWSTPFKNTDGTILGTFALYRRVLGSPSEQHLRLIKIVTHLAAVMIGRNRSEAAWKDSERRFRTIFEQAAVGVAQLNSITGEILRVNNCYCEIIGMKETQLVGRTWMDLTHPEDMEVDRANMARLRRGDIREFAIEKRLQRLDGTYVWINLNVSPMWQPGEDATEHIAIVQDITQRRLADEERHRRQRVLEKLDERVRQLFLSVQGGQPFFEIICRDIESLIKVDLCAVPIVDPGGMTFTYRAASGTKSDMLLGKSMPLTDGGLCGWVIEHDETLNIANLPKDARVLPELSAALEVTTAILAPLTIEGRVIGGLSVFRGGEPFTDFDLRTLNLYAQSVAAAYENWLTLSRLEARVAERTEELAETNAELESFARTVSHDLRAPLRAMEGFAVALAEDYGHQIDDEGREFIRHIVDSAKRLDCMVADLLAYSRLGQSELRVTSIGLDTIVAESLKQLRAEMEFRNAIIRVDERMPAVLGHRSTLVQIVTNLVSNALKFVPEFKRPEVHIGWESPSEGRVRLIIQDNGIGIEENDQKRIFQVFHRLHGIESYPGTGIGLAIVARGCERLGGTCGVQSQPGDGSRFWIEFPA